MATRVVMPQMGYDMQQGTVVRWLKQEGEEVGRGEAIAEIETDKAVVEMQAYASGTLRHIVASEGRTVPVGEIIAVIGTLEEEIPQEWLQSGGPSAAAAEGTEPTPQPPTSAAEAPKTEGSRQPPTETPRVEEAGDRRHAGGRVRASPLARRMAEEHGVDLARIEGSGPGGRVVEEDVRAHLGQQGAAAPAAPGRPAPEAQPAAEAPPQEGEAVELSRMRQAIARLTTRAKQEVPHFYVTAEIRMDAAMSVRQQLNQELQEQGVRVSVNDLIIRACVLALKKHPQLNASFEDGSLRRYSQINIGIAVALEQGLIVPVLSGCDDKSLVETARDSRALVQRTQEGRLAQSEYTGGTFSISNLGMYDVDSFAAIIFPPQAAVLATGSVKRRPAVVDDRLTVAQVLQATLSVDHRVADGAEAAQFLAEVKRTLENPVALLV